MKKEYGFLHIEILYLSERESDVVRTSNVVATYIQEGNDDCGFDFWDENEAK